MEKEIYVVNCYTCQHNGQETCKGCNTLLNGDVEPYENWELREDLSQKDQRIAELEQELAIKDKMINLIWIDLFHLNNDNNDWTKSVAQYQKEAIEKLKEGDTNE